MANHQCAWKLIYTKTLKKILHTCSVIDHMLCQNMVRTKKWHMGCSLANVPGIQLRKWMELISKGAAVIEE